MFLYVAPSLLHMYSLYLLKCFDPQFSRLCVSGRSSSSVIIYFSSEHMLYGSINILGLFCKTYPHCLR